MCSGCGCQSITVIKLLTLQHEEIINKLGQARRAAERNDLATAQGFAYELANLLNPHSAFEERGLFAALKLDDEFVEPLEKLTLEHKEINGLVGRLIEGDISVVGYLDTLLRNHISNEENGIFPASVSTIDGELWDQIEKDQGYVGLPRALAQGFMSGKGHTQAALPAMMHAKIERAPSLN